VKIYSVKELFGEPFPEEAGEVARLTAALIFDIQRDVGFLASDADGARRQIVSEAAPVLFNCWRNSDEPNERLIAAGGNGTATKDDIVGFLRERELARLQRERAELAKAKASYIAGAFAGSGVPGEGTDRIIAEIKAERAAQDAQWGGADHDDRHGMEEFAEFIDGQLTKCAHGRGLDSRERFIKIAALALAAVESHDRKSVAYASQVLSTVFGED